jgi:apolipoprotein D and lipocalin family protein
MNPHRSIRKMLAAAGLMVLANTPPHAVAQPPAAEAPATPTPLRALPSLDVPSYMGTWYQVAWFPNRFQSQCVSDTSARYALRADGRVEVLNRCRLADGRYDDADGIARPAGSTLTNDRLSPAQLEVSFLPALLRWIPAWGSYWVIALADDGRYAVVSEPQRQYLWVLARAPRLTAEDEAAIRSTLVRQGFDLGRWQTHPHTAESPSR